MTCPGCGRTMNHHADKPFRGDVASALEEVYACAGCGAVAARRLAASPADDQDAAKR